MIKWAGNSIWHKKVNAHLVYKLQKSVGTSIFSVQFFFQKKSHYKNIGYSINVLQQTAYLVVNPITVGNFAFLFNCTPAGQTSIFFKVLTYLR